jgi:uncharacterized protein
MSLVSQAGLTCLIALASFVIHKVAKKHGFYFCQEKNLIKVPLAYLLGAFLIYFFTFLVFPPIFTEIYRHFHKQNLFAVFGWAQLVASLLCLMSLWRFSLHFNHKEGKKIWKNSSSSLYQDCKIGAFTWILGFPISLAAGQFFDILIQIFFQAGTYEQTAVHQLKMAFQSKPLLVSTLVSILLFAPVVEEFLFRGLLQNFFKKFMRPTYAIFFSSLIFAIIHISYGQGIGNIPLTAALFSFGCFLGFIYEKQGSLFSSITLHMVFNCISTLEVMYYSGFFA